MKSMMIPEVLPPEKKNKGGRPKGSRNKRSVVLSEALEALGARPEEVLAGIITGKNKQLEELSEYQRLKLVIEAARSLLPFCYPKLASMEVDLKGGLPGVSITIVEDRRPGGDPKKGND